MSKAKTTKTAIPSPKVAETKLGEFLTKLIYATFADIEQNWNGDLKYSPYLYLTYKNLLEADKESGLKTRFTLPDQIKQHLAFLLNKMAEEINNSDLASEDTLDVIRGKLVDANAECYTDFMYGIAAQYRPDFGPTLLGASDQPTFWIRGQLVGKISKHASDDKLVSSLYVGFTDFLKSLAWLMGRLIWYQDRGVDAGMFLGFLFTHKMEQSMLDNLSAELRAKPPTKPRAKPKAKIAEEKPTEEKDNVAEGDDETTKIITADEVEDENAEISNALDIL